jgi:ribosomal protein L7/L12
MSQVTPSLAQKLFNALNDEQKKEMCMVTYDWITKKNKKEANFIILTKEERGAAYFDKIVAIRMVRSRTNCSLREAKEVVDREVYDPES